MNHDEKKYPPGTPVASLGDLQAVALAGLWVWSQKASKAILAADLLEEKGSTLAEHFNFSLIVWYAPPTPAVPDGPKKGLGVGGSILTVADLEFADRLKRLEIEFAESRSRGIDAMARIKALENDVANLKKGCIE
jgi:hypothetical protein